MYLYDVLNKYQVNNSAKNLAFNTFKPVIQQWAGLHLLDFDFSGSTAKGTEVSCSSDFDFFISLSTSTPDSLSQIFNSLFNKLSGYSDISIRKQNVSIGVTWQGQKIDLTPGKKHSGNTNYHSVYKNKTDSWTQTNIQQHINIVRGSQRINEIKLAKIWRENHQLEWPSIFLELFVIDSLRGHLQNNLAANFAKVLTDIFTTVETKFIQDPSNTNNILSNDLNQSEKIRLRNQAYTSLQSRTWSHVVW